MPLDVNDSLPPLVNAVLLCKTVQPMVALNRLEISELGSVVHRLAPALPLGGAIGEYIVSVCGEVVLCCACLQLTIRDTHL